MGLCVLYYVEYSLYNVKKVGFFYLGWNCTLNYFSDFDEISQKYSCNGPLQNLFNEFDSFKNLVAMATKLKFF